MKYLLGESDSGLLGGSSNLRAPFWVPANYLLIQNMRRWSLTTCAAPAGKLRSLPLHALESKAILHLVLRGWLCP